MRSIDKTAAIRAAILTALESGPKTTPELIEATGWAGLELSNRTKMLLREGLISREEITKGRFRYYAGTTAPGWTGYVPSRQDSTAAWRTRGTDYKVPVVRMNYPAEGGRTNRVTLVAVPGVA